MSAAGISGREAESAPRPARPEKEARSYMTTRWFQLLRAEVQATSQADAARRIGVTPSCVCQVLNGGGQYGNGGADTEKFGRRVELMLGRVLCPFISATAGESRLITGDACRDYAYRDVPTGSSMATRHWQACRKCPSRVPAPRGWDETKADWIEDKFAERAPKLSARADALGVAAPDLTTSEPTTEEAQ